MLSAVCSLQFPCLRSQYATCSGTHWEASRALRADWSAEVGVSASPKQLTAEAQAERGDAALGSFNTNEHLDEEAMPYMLISTQIRLENGPTNVGDEYSDPEIMNYLGARKSTILGNNFSEYQVDDPPRLVLDKLEKIGFRLQTMTGVGQTLVWCLHKETE